MFSFLESLTKTLSDMGNKAVVAMVIVVVACVLGLAFKATASMNKAVGRNTGGDAQNGQGG